MSTLNLVGALFGAALTLVGALLVNGTIGHPIDGQLPSLWGWSVVMMGLAVVMGSAADLIAMAVRHLLQHRHRG